MKGYAILNKVTKFFEQDILNPGHVPARLLICDSIIQKPCLIPNNINKEGKWVSRIMHWQSI